MKAVMMRLRGARTQTFLILSVVEGRRVILQRCILSPRPSTTLRSAQGEENFYEGSPIAGAAP